MKKITILEKESNSLLESKAISEAFETELDALVDKFLEGAEVDPIKKNMIKKSLSEALAKKSQSF